MVGGGGGGGCYIYQSHFQVVWPQDEKPTAASCMQHNQH